MNFLNKKHKKKVALSKEDLTKSSEPSFIKQSTIPPTFIHTIKLGMKLGLEGQTRAQIQDDVNSIIQHFGLKHKELVEIFVVYVEGILPSLNVCSSNEEDILCERFFS